MNSRSICENWICSIAAGAAVIIAIEHTKEKLRKHHGRSITIKEMSQISHFM